MGAQKVITLVGPTAVGKTGFSVRLAKDIGGEIISADSRQAYRGLNIGTGKVTAEEMQGMPHHMLDVADPSHTFTAADFVKEGRAAIAAIAARGRVPIIVGGTGFYIDALLGKVILADVPANERLRDELRHKNAEELMAMLQTLDPERARTIDAKNRVRLVRALEIATELGFVPMQEPHTLYETLWIGLRLPSEELKQNIHTRLLARLQENMLEEAKQLHEEGLSWERMYELGLEYRSMAYHLTGTISYEEMLAQLEKEIVRYAKRQMTWFKRNKEINWFLPNEKDRIHTLVLEFLHGNNR